jgi:hypothetical protein
MASSNTNIKITELDFNNIKSNFITYLQSQDTFKDYNFQGSAMSVLLDVLAYNTQYNAFYLNMVANELFLDSALQRSSVVSQAKLLDYTPKSSIAPEAHIKFVATGIDQASYTLPKFTNFMSEAINRVNYNFVTTDSITVNVVSNTATFEDVKIKQGIPAIYRFTVDSTTNPKYLFQIIDKNIDTRTILVNVQQSSSNVAFETYQTATDYLSLDSTSKVYFLQEAYNGNYELYFGDGILGNKLQDGNIVIVSYITTDGTMAEGANNFLLMSNLTNINTHTITPLIKAAQGSDKESIESIKYQAPKSYAAQNRAVTKEDYITLIQQNKLGITFDAVNVWGGEQNNPPVYGQVFVSLKPTGAYSLTTTQKARLIQDVIKPISVMTVEPTIVDPDYTYLKIDANVLYDPKKTTLSSNGINNLIKTSVSNFASNTLNTFNSTFSVSELIIAIQNANPSIISNEVSIRVQKKIYPNLTTPTTYKLYYGVPLKKGMFLSGVSSSPSLQERNPLNLATNIDGIYIEEVPSSTGGIDSIFLLNPGYAYQTAPKVTILGDGTGATAQAVINSNGTIKKINVLTAGKNYTSAIVKITAVSGDTTGQSAAGIVNLEGQYGTLRTYYNNIENVKTIINSNAGIIDYGNGIITLTAFNPLSVNNPLGQLTVSANPSTTIISSSYNRIITVDAFDPNAINVNVIAKTS